MALKQVEMAYGKGAVMQLGSAEVAKVHRCCIALQTYGGVEKRFFFCCPRGALVGYMLSEC